MESYTLYIQFSCKCCKLRSYLYESGLFIYFLGIHFSIDMYDFFFFCGWEWTRMESWYSQDGWMNTEGMLDTRVMCVQRECMARTEWRWLWMHGWWHPQQPQQEVWSGVRNGMGHHGAAGLGKCQCWALVLRAGTLCNRNSVWKVQIGLFHVEALRWRWRSESRYGYECIHRGTLSWLFSFTGMLTWYINIHGLFY